MNPPALKEQIRLAFDGVPVPPGDSLPGDFRYFARDKHWATLPTAGLFLHRNALAAFPANIFAAYIAGFMIGGLVDGPYETDLLACATHALTPDRHAQFTDTQHAAIAAFLTYATDKLHEAGIRNYNRPRSPRQIQRQ